MDADRFDALTRALAAPGGSRRRLLGGLAAGLAALLGADRADAAGCRTRANCPRCHRCRKKPGARRGRCVPTPGVDCGGCGRCDSNGACVANNFRCDLVCQRCNPTSLTCEPSPGSEGQICDPCRTCQGGACLPDDVTDGDRQGCGECGVCQGGACAPLEGVCGSTEAACSVCTPRPSGDFVCAEPEACAPCELCTQEGCVRDDALRCGAGLECCGQGVCCAAGERCLNGSCCPQARACGTTCCAAGLVCEDPRFGRCCAQNRSCGATCCKADSGLGLQDGEVCTRDGCCPQVKAASNCRADDPGCSDRICCAAVWTQEGRGLACPPGAGVPPGTRGYCCGPGKSCCFTGCCPSGSSCCGNGTCCPAGTPCGSASCSAPTPDHV